MSGGIQYHPRLPEQANLKRSLEEDKALQDLLQSHQAKIIPEDPDSYVRVEELPQGTQYTVVLPMARDPKINESRLFLFDRFLLSRGEGRLLLRSRAFDTQNNYFPKGPVWLMDLLEKNLQGPEKILFWDQALLRDLRSLPEPQLASPEQTQYLHEFIQGLHKKIPKPVFKTLMENQEVFQDLVPPIQERYMTFRLPDPQTGYSILVKDGRLFIRMILVIDVPKEAGFPAEQNGRLYLLDDYLWNTQSGELEDFQRKIQTAPNPPEKYSELLQILEQAPVPDLKDPQMAPKLKAIAQAIHDQEFPSDGQKPPVKERPISARELHPEEEAFQNLLKKICQEILSQVQFELGKNPKKPSLQALEETLSLTLGDRVMNEATLRSLEEKYALSAEARQFLKSYYHLSNGDPESARKTLAGLSSKSLFLNKLETSLGRLSDYLGAREALPLLQSAFMEIQTRQWMKAQAWSGSHPNAVFEVGKGDDIPVQKYFQKIKITLQSQGGTLRQAILSTAPDSEVQGEIQNELIHHPLLRELLHRSEEADPISRHEKLHGLAFHKLLAKHQMVQTAQVILQQLPRDNPAGEDLQTWVQHEESLGQKLEILHPQLRDQVFSPGTLLAMSAAGVAGGAGKLFGLARFQKTGRLAHWAGESLALFAEAPTFVLTEKVFHSYQDSPVGLWSKDRFWKDMAAAYLVFGPMRGAGILNQGLGRKMANYAWWQLHPRSLGVTLGVSTHTLTPAALILGNSLSRSSALGLLPPSEQGWQADALDDIILYFHYLMGGALAHGLVLKNLPNLAPGSRVALSPMEIQPGLKTEVGSPSEITQVDTTPVPETSQGLSIPELVMPELQRETEGARLVPEMTLRRIQHTLVEPLAHLEAFEIITRYDAKTHREEKQSIPLGKIPLGNTQRRWVLGRENPGDWQPDISLSPNPRSLSRIQGYFEISSQGQFTFTDLSHWGTRVEGFPAPTRLPVPLKTGSLIEIGVDRSIQIIFTPAPKGTIPKITSHKFGIPVLEKMERPARARLHPTFGNMEPLQARYLLENLPGTTDSQGNQRPYFGKILTLDGESIPLEIDKTLWLLGSDPQPTAVGFQGDHIGTISFQNPGQELAPTHAALYVDPQGRVVLQKLGNQHEIFIQTPQDISNTSDPQWIYSPRIPLIDWTYLNGMEQIFLGNYLQFEFTHNNKDPLSDFLHPNQRYTGLLTADEVITPQSRARLPRWENQELILEGKIHLDIVPTPEISGGLMKPDTNTGRPTLVVPDADGSSQGAEIFSREVLGARLYFIRPTGQGKNIQIKTHRDHGFMPVPAFEENGPEFSLTEGSILRIGDYEFTIRIPE